MGTFIQCKLSTASFLLVFLLALAAVECQVHALQVGSLTSSVVRGQVLDAETGQPIEDATVAVWEFQVSRRRTVTTLKEVTKTGVNGSYELHVEGGFYCNVYTYYDDPRSPGYDYVPRLQSFTLERGEEVTLHFALVPAASLLFEGDLLFVDSSRPPESFGFTVVPADQGPDMTGCVLTYGTSSHSHNRFIDVDQMQVIIPANTMIQIKVEAQTEHIFVIDEPQFSQLERGDELRIRVDKYSLPYNLNLTRDLMHLTAVQVNETEQMGFYVTAEKRDLEDASILIADAEAAFVGGLYKECYADLREAYTKTMHIYEKVQFMYVDASASTVIIILFLALTSVSLSYLLHEHWAKKVLSAGLFYTLFLAVLFHVYSGCQIVDTPSLLTSAGLAILASFLIAFILPRLFPMAITAFFSLAKRNLKRRRTRFTLTLVTVTALVMSFVALTSFSTEYGFTSTTIKTGNREAEGLLIRQPLPQIPTLTAETQVVSTFDPLEASVVDWLQQKPEVTLVAPKYENMPTRRPLGSLSTPSQRVSLFGVLGLSPSAEAETTGFDTLLVEEQGRYLYDDEEDTIMISVEAADALNVEVGEHLVLRIGSMSIGVTLVGLLDDHGLSQITDFDGAPMIPEKLIIVVEMGVLVEARIESCEPSEVVVTNQRTALKLSYHMLLSRIDVLAEESVDLLPFARQIALERDYWVWAAVEGGINLLGLMTYLEAKGVSVFIPWLIVILNVVFTMLNAIYERRSELVILSSVGLNPTHITSLFVVEALIIGVLGGGIGYLLGLSLYKLMPLLSLSMFVRQKISAAWCLASLGIAMAAVLVGAVVALKSSVDITPSMLRRWRTGKPPQMGDPWVFNVPFRVREEELDSLFEYVAARFRSYLNLRGIDEESGKIQFLEEDGPDGSTRTIHFKYVLGNRSNIGHLPFQLVAKKGANEDAYSFEVICRGTEDAVRDTVSFLRMALIEWSSIQNRS